MLGDNRELQQGLEDNRSQERSRERVNEYLGRVFGEKAQNDEVNQGPDEKQQEQTLPVGRSRCRSR